MSKLITKPLSAEERTETLNQAVHLLGLQGDIQAHGKEAVEAVVAGVPNMTEQEQALFRTTFLQRFQESANDVTFEALSDAFDDDQLATFVSLMEANPWLGERFLYFTGIIGERMEAAMENVVADLLGDKDDEPVPN